MSVSQTSDVLIVGAGVIGLSIGIAILESSPRTKVKVVDKEVRLGMHASGRNSGVLHAGFYYSPDSLKAKFCRDGNFELRKLCRESGIPVLEVGKVVVSRDLAEDARLDLLFYRGISNGVELELLDKSLLPNFEPLAITNSRFLWSPKTAISDSSAVLNAMVSRFQRMGGCLETESEVKILESMGQLYVQNHEAKWIVNAAGAQSDRLARPLGIAREFAMIPFMGMYRSVSREMLPIKTLVYPVPHPVNPFLGVHLTLTLDGKTKIGPTATPVLGREQYSPFEGWSISDIANALIATTAIIRGSDHDFSEILKSEIPKVREKSIVSEAASMVPSARTLKKWTKQRPGIRSQLVNIKTGKLEQDFIVKAHLNSTHVLNAVSPGWTSSIPFGRWVAENYIEFH